MDLFGGLLGDEAEGGADYGEWDAGNGEQAVP